MKYKVGDRVRIKNIDWYNKYTNGTKVDCGAYPFTSGMKKFCGQERIIANVCQECYVLLGIDDRFVWTDEMIEECVESIEDRLKELRKMCTISLTDSNYTDKVEVLLNDYEYIEENGKTFFVKKKKKYPKTYEECCCYFGNFAIISNEGYKNDLIKSFYKLLVCRDAYWRIAGEEMDLKKPWEPDWKNDEQFKYIIICRRGCIIKDTYTAKDVILSFPTAEMRDAFYECFKSEIEMCKELL